MSRRASMLLGDSGPPAAAMCTAAAEAREAARMKALTLQPEVSPEVEAVLMRSSAWSKGLIVPSNLPEEGWVINNNDSGDSASDDERGEDDDELADALLEGARHKSLAGHSRVRADESSSRASISSIASADSAALGVSSANITAGLHQQSSGAPHAWFPATAVFGRRDSLLKIMHDKSLSDDERKSLRRSRSAGSLGLGGKPARAKKGDVPINQPRKMRHHVKEYAKVCVLRADQRASFFPEPMGEPRQLRVRWFGELPIVVLLDDCLRVGACRAHALQRCGHIPPPQAGHAPGCSTGAAQR
jgi:hypothetical protein